MKLKSKVIKGSLILCVLGGLAIALTLWRGNSHEGKRAAGTGISLVKPAFAQTVQTSTFPAETAGICAYMNVGKSINSEKLVFSPIFKRIEDKGQDYIIGIVQLEETLWTKAFPYVYVNNDGWIAAYYPVNTSSCLLVNWAKYDGGPVIETTLHNAIEQVLSELKLGSQRFGYYHFGYPEATNIFLGVKSVDRGEEEKFAYTIPSDVKIYESSYSARWLPGSYDFMRVYIDGVKVSVISDTENSFIPKEYLTPERRHEVTVGSGDFALAFVYGSK